LAINFQQGDNEHPHWHQSRVHGSLHTKLVVAASSGQQHCWGMMRGSGGGKVGYRPGDKFSYTMGLHASIDHGGCRCSTATMGPHSQLLSIEQSAKIIWDRSALLKQEKAIIINVN
jgi:hypothetical protein